MDYKKLQECIDEKFIVVALDKGVSISDLYVRFQYRRDNLIGIYRVPREHYSKILVGAYLGVMSKDYGVSKEDRRSMRLII